MNSSALNDLAGLITPMVLKDRIQALIDAGFRKSELAKAAGKSPAAVTHWLNGETKEIKADSAAGLQALTGFSSIWISEGKGPKKINTITAPSAYVASSGGPAQPTTTDLAAPDATESVARSLYSLDRLFDMLPDDPILRATVFHAASAVILDAINGRPTPTAAPARTGSPEKSRA